MHCQKILLLTLLLSACANKPQPEPTPQLTEPANEPSIGSPSDLPLYAEGQTEATPTTERETPLSALAVWDSEVGIRGTSNDDTYRIKYMLGEPELPLNDPFSVLVAIFNEDGQLLEEGIRVSVDAGMPQHRHGMLRIPKIGAVGDGTYLAEGMLFHMPGSWELYVDVTEMGVTERTQFTVLLD